MTESKYLYGRMHFEDGYRPVIMWRGTKYWHAIYIDSMHLVKRFVLFTEEKHFEQWCTSDTDLKRIKKIVKFMVSRSKFTGLKREMTQATKKILKECLAYSSEKQS